MPGWTNWARNQTCSPAAVSSPSTVDELADAVKQAPGRIKPVGSGHSFTGVALTDGLQLRLDKLSGVVAASTETGLVTLYAGTTLHDVPGLLEPYGLAMTNLGDIDAQTIAGAISTGTHGTGASYGGLATQVRGLTIVLADGSVVDCAAGDDLFEAARLSLGALGVLATVTLQCEPAFRLVARERPVRFDEMLATFSALALEHDHAEFYWFPHSDWTLSKVNDRTSDPRAPLGRLRSYVDDDLLSNTVFGALCRLGSWAPSTIPTVGRISARALGGRTFTDDSPAVFASSRRVRFREMEYALPRPALLDAVREVRALIERRGWRISFPLEVRVAAADDVWLSTSYGRDSGYIAVHQYFRTDHTEYFDAVESVFRSYGGRPHWGKLHSLDAADLGSLYPRFTDFIALRDRLDPDRRFANDYLDRVLGP